MRRLVVTQNITLDGSIEMLGDWFDAQAQGEADNTDHQEEMERQDSQADGFLCGRRTFEDLRDYWRDLEDDTTGVSAYLNSVQKYVVSSTLTDPDWAGTEVIASDPIASIAELKHDEGKDIVCTGSITLVHALVEAGLVDEYRLFVYPTVQGRGRRLFPDGWEQPSMTLLEARSFRNGQALLRYAAG